MSTTLTVLIAGIAGYLGLVAFVLALARGARIADEAAERHARSLRPRTERFSGLEGELRLRDCTPDDLDLWRATRPREVVGERRRPRRHAG